MSTKYRVHRFDIRMTGDQIKLEQFLNSLEGEIITIIPNVTWFPKTDPIFIGYASQEIVYLLIGIHGNG